MTHKEYKDILKFELYRNWNISNFQKFRLKYLSPNTNCIFLARRMWYLYSCGKFKRIISKIIYKKIIRKYGCIIYPNAKVGKGFNIVHPVGIVIGQCTIGEDFTIYQNCTIGVRRENDESKGLIPVVGNNVRLCSSSLIIGAVNITDNVTIGANSLIIHDIECSGTYVGNPAKKVR